MDSLFFWFSKLVWLLITPDSLLLIYFSLGIFLVFKQKLYLAKIVFVSLFTVFMVIGFFPVGEWLLYPLEKRYAANPKLERVDGVIMLGGAEKPVESQIWQQPVLGEAAERYFAFIHLAKKYPEAKRVYAGGSGSMVNQQYKEADVAKQLFTQQELDVSTVNFEYKSRNTWENITFSKALANPKKGERWVLVTTAWHMPRAMGIFCKARWDVVPYPVDFTTDADHLFRLDWDFARHLNGLKTGVKEWIGITFYRFSGKMCH